MDNFEERLHKLENRVLSLETLLVSKEKSATSPSIPQTPPPYKAIETEHTTEKKRYWLLENWQPVLGLFFILFGLAWFLQYAFTSNWFSFTIRCLICLTTSFSVASLGVYFMPRKATQGTLLLTLGSAGMILSFWAADVLYQFLTPSMAMTGMVITTLGVGALAIRFHSEKLALLSAFFSLLVPALVPFQFSTFNPLTYYFFAINCVVIVGLYCNAWCSPVFIACGVTSIYQLFFLTGGKPAWFCLLSSLLFFLPWPFFSISPKNKWEKNLFLGAFISLLSFLTLTEALRANFPLFYSNLILPLVASFLLISAYFLARKEHFSFGQKALALAWGIIIYYCLFTFTDRLLIQETDKITLYFFEIILAMLFSSYALKSQSVTKLISLLFLLPGYKSFFAEPIDVHFFWTLLAGTLSLGAGAWLVSKDKENTIESGESILWPISCFYFIGTIWLGCELLIAKAIIAHVVALILYVFLGSSIYCFGTHKKIRQAGAILILGATFRALIVEAWELYFIEGIITFLCIGGCLLGTAFIPRIRQKTMQNEATNS